jgi:probable rRNA maturation factor
MTFFRDCEEKDELKLAPLQEILGKSIDSDTPLAVELLFVDSEEIRALNNETRSIDKVTDVLSFPTLDGIKGKAIVGSQFPFDKDEDGRLVLGSIVICKDRAKEQAEEYGHSYRRELHYLFVHGVMHCLGYDHIEEQDKTDMRAAEERVLEKMGIVRA